MLSRDENEILTRVGPGTPMGELMRRYWVPAALSRELPEPDCPPVRVKLLSENLVAFRDTSGLSNCRNRRNYLGAPWFAGKAAAVASL